MLLRRKHNSTDIEAKIFDLIDDSQMPSAEESKKIVIPEELREKMRKSEDELAHKLGYY